MRTDVGRRADAGPPRRDRGTIVTGAVLIVGPVKEAAADFAARLSRPALEPPEMLAGVPLSCVEILGRSMLARTLEWLRIAQVEPVTLLAVESIANLLGELPSRGIEAFFTGRPEDLWLLARQKVSEYFANGIPTVLLARLGAYVEFDLADILQFHKDRGSSLCRAFDGEGPLDFWVLGREVVDAMANGTSGPPDREKLPVHSYVRCQYVNRLRNAREMRQFAVDCLHSRCSIRPGGTEVKPGVWVDDGAHLHRKARVVPPAYIGRRTKVQASALITRSSSLERDCEVDGGTVVEDACILANTYLGRWLDVTHAVVDGSKFVDLRSNVAVEIADGAFVSRTESPEARSRRGYGGHLNFVQRLGGRMKRALLH